MSGSGYRTFVISVPAGETRLVGGTGEFVACFAADQTEFFIRPDSDGAPAILAAGVKMTMPLGADGRRQRFKQVLVSNPNGTVLNATLAIGDGDITDQRFSTTGTLLVAGTVDVGTIANPVSISGRINNNISWDASRVLVDAVTITTLLITAASTRVMRVGAGALDLQIARGTVAPVDPANGWVIPAGEWMELEVTNSFLTGLRLPGDGAALAYVQKIVG